MKTAANIAGALLGLAFLFFGLNFFLKFIPMPPPPPTDSPVGMFMGAMLPTGYMAFVKAFEILGGLFSAIPKTRALGLFLLGPVIVNILAFHTFIMKGAGLVDPMLLLIVALFAFLVWVHRKNMRALLSSCEPEK